MPLSRTMKMRYTCKGKKNGTQESEDTATRQIRWDKNQGPELWNE